MTSYEIDLRGGHNSNIHAARRWCRLDSMIMEMIYQFRQDLLYEYATVLSSYRASLRWRIKEQNHWTIELLADEWEALSLGLRHAHAPHGFMSMYQWLNLKKVEA